MLAVAAITSIAPPNGPSTGGTLVNILGNNFRGATGVSFGALQASNFQVVSAAQINATSPAEAAGMVDIEVINASGNSVPVTADHYSYLQATTTNLTVMPRPGVANSVQLTASVAAPNGPPLNSGSVIFKDGTATIGTVSLGQPLTLTYTLPAGNRSLTATYLPADGTFYVGTTSAAVNAALTFAIAGPTW